jgi:AraC-like DNA-binding protein
METVNIIESSLAALEKRLRISIAIIDNAGAFHTKQGFAVFSATRQSHQKNPVCSIGFCKKCRMHCRFAMNEKCAKHHEPFVETCWKGITEIIIPLYHAGIHYGMFYAGSWREVEAVPAIGLPKKFYKLYNQLPPLPSPGKIEDITNILTIFSAGIISFLSEYNAFDIVPDTRGNQIIEFIRKFGTKKITLTDLAAHLNLSCSRTSYLLRTTLNKSFPELLTEERLKRVKTLLASTNMTLNEIAVQTGFNDEYYLSRIFKRQNSQTPGQYRKLHMVTRAEKAYIFSK